MKKQIKPTVKARLFQGAFLLVIPFLLNDVTPVVLGQGDSSNQSSTHARAQWVWQNPLPQGNWLFGVSFTDANNGTAVGGYGAIVRTTDGGAHWLSQTSGTTSDLNAVSFTDANNGTAVSWYGIIIRTTDGGTNWVQQNSGTGNFLWGVSFTDANNGTAVGEDGTIRRTTNGGQTWVHQTSGTTNFLWGVSFTDANNGTAVGGTAAD